MSSPRWNNDILHDICEHLAPSSFPSLQEDRSGLVALARCARTSSVLFQPAVDVLWRQVDSLDVLLNILTAHPHQSSSSESSTSSSVWHSHTLNDDIDEEAHARLRYYASRVRRLAHRSDTCRIHPATIARLHAPLRGASLFPALLVLRWHQRIDGDVSAFLPYVPPTLRELVVTGIGHHLPPPISESSATAMAAYDAHMRAVVDAFIAAANAHVPALAALTLSGRIHSSAVVRLGELTGLRQLRIINFAHQGFLPPHLPVLRSCATLGLREFCISLTGDDDDDAVLPADDASKATGATTDAEDSPAAALTSGYFAALHTLRVHGTLSLVSRLLARVSSPTLTTLSLFVPRPDRWQDYLALLSLLSARFAPSLRALSLSGSWAGCPTPAALLSPLLALRNLEELSVVAGTGVALSLTPADVEAMARAWPKLRTLALLYQPARAELPIAALGAFADGCPELHTLVLASADLRAPTVPVTSVLASTTEKMGRGENEWGARTPPTTPATPKAHGLRHIWLAGDAAPPRAVARALDALFPRLDLGPFDCPWHPSWNPDGWRKVTDALRVVKAERAARVAGGV